MTEAEWRTGTDPAPLLELVSQRRGDRKPRLFACDCCRRLWHLLSDLERAVVDAIERCAEGLIHPDKIYQAVGIPHGFPYTSPDRTEVQRIVREAATQAWIGAKRSRAYVVDLVRKTEGSEGRIAEWKRQSDAIRCIFGNPFRPVTFEPAWRTDTVLALAQQMYEAREFGAMPILADALQEVPSARREGFAGCDSDEMLNHARNSSAHARGCWVVDLVLEKA
jgi:hypothetical protein